MDKILTSKDIANFNGVKSSRDLMFILSRHSKHPWGGAVCKGPSVIARVDFGRWLADCECGGSETVDPEYPFFFCCSCGNAAQTGLARPVEFPGKLDEIEAELLNRPGVLSGMLVKPVVPGLTRDWRPGEKVSDLKKQRILLEKAGK